MSSNYSRCADCGTISSCHKFVPHGAAKKGIVLQVYEHLTEILSLQPGIIYEQRVKSEIPLAVYRKKTTSPLVFILGTRLGQRCQVENIVEKSCR